MRAVKAAASGVLLALLLVAPPWLLVHFVGNPWPAEGSPSMRPSPTMPSLGSSPHFFGSCGSSSRSVWRPRCRGSDKRPGRQPSARGIRFQQQLARRLVSGIVIATAATHSSALVVLRPVLTQCLWPLQASSVTSNGRRTTSSRPLAAAASSAT